MTENTDLRKFGANTTNKIVRNEVSESVAKPNTFRARPLSLAVQFIARS